MENNITSVLAEVEDALYAALNMESPATLAGLHLAAFKGLDVAWHFDKIRAALHLIAPHVHQSDRDGFIDPQRLG